jgi:hypothetical protein
MFKNNRFSVRDGAHRGPARRVLGNLGADGDDPIQLWSKLRLTKARMTAIENQFAQAEATGKEPDTLEQLTARHEELANDAAILADLLRRTGARPTLGWN